MSDAIVWRASIAQGILEGVMFGLVLSGIYTAVVGISSGARCPYLFAATHLAGMLAATLACWAVGGILAIGLATLSPDFYRHAFIGVPADFASTIPYAWVGGSIWGVEFGGVFCLFVGAVLFLARWRRIVREQQAACFFGGMRNDAAEPPVATPEEPPSKEITR